MDYYSKYPEFAKLESKTASCVIMKMKMIFSRQGIPETLIADNVPFSSAEFEQFAAEWHFTVVTSSPRYPKSNGEAEKYVGILKKLLLKCAEDGTDPNIALLRYRNTPVTGMQYSPAQILFGRRLRDTLPVKPSLLKPITPTDSRKQLRRRQNYQAKYYNRGARQRKDFKEGESVRVIVEPKTNEWVPAVVSEKHSTPRSYIVTTDKGHTLKRNRIMMNKTPETVVVNPPYPGSTDRPSATEQLQQKQPTIDSSAQEPAEQSVPATSQPRTSSCSIKAPRWHEDYQVSVPKLKVKDT